MSLFSRKSKLEKLQLKYQYLLQQSRELSIKNKHAGADKFIEAQLVMDQIVSLYPLHNYER